jgi:hypothetical protein
MGTPNSIRIYFKKLDLIFSSKINQNRYLIWIKCAQANTTTPMTGGVHKEGARDFT